MINEPGNPEQSGGFGNMPDFGDYLALAGSAVGAYGNYKSTQATNETNKDINQQQLEYAAAMTQRQWMRDDKAHQREVRDLEKAGLSPLAAINGAPNSGAMTPNAPIAMQAPQVDVNSIINTMLQNKALNETSRHNKQLEGYKEQELSNTAEQIKNQAASIEIENKKVQQTIKYQADLIEQQNKQIEETIRNNKSKEDLAKCSYESEQYWKEINEQTGGKCPSYDVYDFDIYVTSKKFWDVKYKHFLEKIGATSTASGSSNSQNLSGGLGLGAGAAGPSGNINAAEGTSHSEYKSENLSQKQEAMLDQFYKENPMPVYHMYRRKK